MSDEYFIHPLLPEKSPFAVVIAVLMSAALIEAPALIEGFVLLAIPLFDLAV